MVPILVSLFLAAQEEPPALSLQERHVVVTAKRYESELEETPAGVTVLRREDFENGTAQTLVDLLQGRAGLFVTKNSSTPQDAVVEARGFNNGGGNGQRLLVMVDGRKANTVTGSHTDWATIPLENIEQVEVIRGPAAALYGDTAVAGVLKITTRRPTPEPTANLEAGFGSFRTFRSYGAYRATEGSVGVSLFAERVTSEGFRVNSGFNGENATALLTWEISPEARAWTKLGLHDDHRQRPGTLTKDEIDRLGRRGSTTLGDESDVRQGFVDLGTDWDVLGGTLTPAVSVTQESADSITTFASGTSASDTESQMVQLSLRHLIKPEIAGLELTLVSGIEANLESADSDSLNDFSAFSFVESQASEYNRRLWGMYARAEARPLSDFLAAAGIRYDASRIEFERLTTDLVGGGSSALDGSERFSNVAPLASLSWFFAERSSVWLSAGRTLRYPNRDELVGFLTTALGLEPERAVSWELGVRSFEWTHLSGSVVLYWMNVHNEIFFVPPPVGEDVFATGNFGQNENVDRVLHRGIELDLESRCWEPLVLQASMTIQRTTIESGPFDGEEMPITPNLSVALTGVWTSTFGVTASASVRYVGERFLLNDLSNDVDPLDDYAVVDARIAYTWKKATAFLEANNLFGKEYFDNGGIGAGSTGIWGARQAFNPAPDENYLAGVAVTF
ncbi:MAG: TonB-dependent receptor [Planctomycetes bacterium]|nr:TonB-dependent receptor [Planctomycetota bacterium]